MRFLKKRPRARNERRAHDGPKRCGKVELILLLPRSKVKLRVLLYAALAAPCRTDIANADSVAGIGVNAILPAGNQVAELSAFR